MRNLGCLETEDEIDRYAEQFSAHSWIAIDCEFMREDTYYPKLCLIQIATPDIYACIDVLKPLSLRPFVSTFTDPSIIKIFHSAGQDLETLLLRFNVLPNPVFDTQIAASLLGEGEQVSYASLVEMVCDKQLPKSQTRTNWAKRPLTPMQLEYALDDVKYLGDVYLSLKERLQVLQRLNWLEQECHDLVDPARFQTNTNELWKRIKGGGSLQGRARYRLNQIASWREHTAQKLDRPKQWVLNNQQLLDIAQSGASFDIHSWEHHGCLNKYHEQLSDELASQITQADKQEYPEVFDDPCIERLTPAQSRLTKKLMQTVRNTATQLDISVSALANRNAIERLVRGKSSRVLNGWRNQVIGQSLLKVIEQETPV